MKLYKEGRKAASLGTPMACRMFEDHRNRFIRFRLCLGMRFLLAFLALIPLQAMSLKDFNAKSDKEQAVYVGDFIDKMTTDLRAKNPELAQNIRSWFADNSIPEPADLLVPYRRQPSRSRPAIEELRSLVIRCVQNMTEEELSELRLPPQALLRGDR